VRLFTCTPRTAFNTRAALVSDGVAPMLMSKDHGDHDHDTAVLYAAVMEERRPAPSAGSIAPQS
jgi:hypothetical protein